MAITFKKTSEFERIRSNIEQHLFDSVFLIEADAQKALHSVEQFNSAIERFLDTIETMYQNPSSDDQQGQKSFPIRDGRYRIFYHVKVIHLDFEITLLDIDDNRQSNLDRFPVHLITFDDES
jgi:hypothetical protein